MNISIANRLLEFRKKSGLSQEELAERLNISRQSVSKWERAESSPDTDNLILLAKIYGVTLDDLLNVDKPIIINNVNDSLEKQSKSKYYIKEGDEEVIVYVKENNSILSEINRGRNNSKVKDFFHAFIVLMTALIYFLLCGLNITKWGQFWVVFVYFPVLNSLVEAIYYKRADEFAYPILMAAVYLTLGVYLSIWHPTWVLFITIPIYYVFVEAIDKKSEVFYKDDEGNEHSIFIKKSKIEKEK